MNDSLQFDDSGGLSFALVIYYCHIGSCYKECLYISSASNSKIYILFYN